MWFKWAVALVFIISPLSTFAEDDFEDNEVDEPEVSEKKGSEYVAPQFVSPVVGSSALFVDWFEQSDAIGKKWIKSEGKKNDVEDSISKYDGEWVIGSPSNIIIEGDKALIVKTKACHHAIAAEFDRPFRFDGKPLVVQYEVKYEDGQECGGGYVKLLKLGEEKNLRQFTDKTPYSIMFGPDKCGQSSKVHFIIRFENPKSKVIKEHHAKQPSKSLSSYFDDHRTHLYKLVIRPDDTFEVSVDNTQLMSGKLMDMEPPLTPPEKIDDPEAKKPADWDDREKIHDPDATKPADWDENAPPKIPDQSATMPSDWLEDEEPLIPSETAEKPKDWDDEMDGEWEAPKVDNPKCKTVSGCGKWTRPLIPNPDYKGKWKPPMIDNPNYKGKWSPKQIDNPEYFIPEPYKQLFPTGALGFELWTMSANIVIDNIYIGDDESAAAEFAKQTFTVKKMQEELFETASSPSQGIFSQLVSATEERPWLWVIYILSILVPVVVISVFCFGRKSRPIADYKKTDEPQNDDEEVPDLIGDDEEAGEEHPEAGDGKNNEVDGVRLRRSSQSPGRKVSPTRKASPSRGISPARKASPGRGVSSVQSDLPSRHSPADLITLEESDKKQEHVEKNKDGDNDEETQKKMEEQGSPRTRHIRQRKAD